MTAVTEKRKQQWRKASAARRKLSKQHGYKFNITLHEHLVPAALEVSGYVRPQDDLTSHSVCERRLSILVTDHLLNVIDDYRCEPEERKTLDRIAAEVKAAFAKG
jgi:hypothetical protein